MDGNTKAFPCLLINNGNEGIMRSSKGLGHDGGCGRVSCAWHGLHLGSGDDEVKDEFKREVVLYDINLDLTTCCTGIQGSEATAKNSVNQSQLGNMRELESY
jgi:hypothetical protein